MAIPNHGLLPASLSPQWFEVQVVGVVGIPRRSEAGTKYRRDFQTCLLSPIVLAVNVWRL
jgi:hypothetical protein